MTTYWASVLALTTLLYVLLDGFDLGVGILFGFTRNERARRDMLSAIFPVWDGNETWLIFTGSILWGAFPRAYAQLLSTFYLPIMLMLCGLILRGVAFEFRYKALGGRWIWDFGFFAGSLVASFVQGVAVGAMVKGLPMVDGRYAGGMLGWFSPFACLCGAGLCLGYSLLGAAWLVLKGDDKLRDRAYGLLRPLTAGVLVFLVSAFLYALALDLRILERWLQRPYLLVLPAIGLIAAESLLRRRAIKTDRQPFVMAASIFITAFLTLAVSFWPYMIPFSLTVDQAASPPASLWFMFWGAGVVVLPVTLIYTIGVYRVFSGKLVGVSYDH